MIDREIETPINLKDAAALLPAIRAGKRPDTCTLYRWTTHGCRGIVLDSIVIGGTRCTSREALERFFSALTARTVGTVRAVGTAVAARQTPISKSPRHDAADRRLVAKGV